MCCVLDTTSEKSYPCMPIADWRAIKNNNKQTNEWSPNNNDNNRKKYEKKRARKIHVKEKDHVNMAWLGIRWECWNLLNLLCTYKNNLTHW